MTMAGITAEQGYASISGEHERYPDQEVPLAYNVAFVCPHCGVFADHNIGMVTTLSPPSDGSSLVIGRQFATRETGVLAAASCQSCHKEVIFFDGRVLVPASSEAPKPANDMPAIVVPDFEEARQIFSASPRGAAALLRLVIQKLMPVLGSTKGTIDAAIAELVANKVIDTQIQQALDTVRVVGNEAVHPGELNLKDDAAITIMLFRLVNFIVERAITQPRQFAELYQGLPAGKLQGIANRDKATS